MKEKEARLRRLKIAIIAAWVMVGLFFLPSLITKPSQGTEGPAVSTGDVPKTTAEPPPLAPDNPPPTTLEAQESLVIDHPLPPEPVAPVTPMASAHFFMWEYACDCNEYCDGFPEAMDPLLLEKIEALRCALDTPIIITSGVRCPRRNDEVGGILNSWHLSGHAADLYAPEIPHTQVAAVARSLGLGVIEYAVQQFDHVEIWQ